MDKHSYPEKIAETMRASSLPIGLFHIEMRTLKAVALTPGLLDALCLSEKDAKRQFDEDPYFLLLPEDRRPISRAMELFLLGKSAFDEAIHIKFGNHTTYHEVRVIGRKFSLEKQTYAYFLFTDLSPFIPSHPNTSKAPLKLQNKTLELKQELYDALTGLPTMNFFFELGKVGVESALSREGVCAVLAFDFMGMKSYNLKFGNQKGDELIAGLSRILCHYFTPLCCARFGADHFYAFAPLKDLEAMLTRVFEEAKKLNAGNSLPLRVGIYRIRDNQTISMVSYCDKAKFACDFDRSTYSSHFTYFTPEMERSIAMRDYALSHLDEALEKGWIKTYYQPIIRSVTGCLCAEEALARWEDPIIGLIEPKDFIPYLEEAHLLYKVDLRIVELIVSDFKAKQKAGIPLVPVSINLSRFDFEKVDMVEEIRKILSASGYPSSMIAIEITEAVAGTAPKFISEQISRFHEAGFKVWMDDFGSGYSSLNVLADFDFDLVKFDMKFMRSFSSNPKSPALLASLLDMAQTLGIDTLCEGVENREQLIFLQNHGCDRIQGYYFQKPASLPATLSAKDKLRRESKEEAPYYQKVGEFSLLHPKGAEDETQGRKAGILEYQNGNLHLLRATADYRSFLEQTDAINLSSFSKTKLPFLKQAPSSFIAAIERCIASGGTESAPFLEEGMPVYRANVRELARKTGAFTTYAIFVELEPSSEENLSGEPLFPSFEAKLLRNSVGKPYDFLFLNCSKNVSFGPGDIRKRLISKTLSEVYPEFDRQWLASAEECLRDSKSVQGETYLEFLNKEAAYVCAPKRGEKDVFSCRLFEIAPEEFRQSAIRESLGGKNVLYQISSILAKDSGLSCLKEVFERVCDGLGCLKAGLYLPSSDSLILFASYSKEKALAHRLSSGAFSSVEPEFEGEGFWDSEKSEQRVASLGSRCLVRPFCEGKARGGYFVVEGYPLDRREEVSLLLRELISLLSPRLSAFLKKPAKKKDKKKERSSKLFSWKKAPSLAERECIESYNAGFLLFGAPFFFLLMALLTALGTKMSNSAVGAEVNLYDVPGYIFVRYIGIGAYFLVSFVAFLYSLLAHKGKIRLNHYAFSSIHDVYLAFSCLLGVLFSWQDYQLGTMNFVYSITLLYIFASFRVNPWKAFVLLASSFGAITLLISYALCLGDEYSYLVGTRLTGLYWTFQAGTILIAAFLEIVMYILFLRMLQLSTIDPLTKTRNRFALNLDKNRYYGNPTLLMVLDIDDFKHWNDTYGHEMGDELLVAFASALRENFGKDDVYRYGGDEFLVIKNEERAFFQRRLESFEETLSRSFGGNKNISFTAGFKEVTFQDDASFLACISSCDSLLYEGKKTGKSMIVEE